MASEWKRPLRRTGIQEDLTRQVTSANHPERTRKVRQYFTQKSRSEWGEIIATTFRDVNSARSHAGASASFNGVLVEPSQVQRPLDLWGLHQSCCDEVVLLERRPQRCGRATKRRPSPHRRERQDEQGSARSARSDHSEESARHWEPRRARLARGRSPQTDRIASAPLAHARLTAAVLRAG